MSKVFLREKTLKHGKINLYLDFYPPIVHPETGKLTRRQHLKLYIYAKPKTETEREHNKETKILGQNIRAQRQLEVQARNYGFLRDNDNKDFIAFYQEIVDSKSRLAESTHYIWKASLSWFKKFAKTECRFRDVTEKFCIQYKNFLSDQTALSQNSQSLYYVKFLAVCRVATEQKKFRENPAKNIRSIPEKEVKKEFLTLEELRKLVNTPFRFETLRRAALFAALTGLRRSDIIKLTWHEIQHSDERGYYIRFQQQKTRSQETLPISDEAFKLLGVRGDQSEKVFKDFKIFHTMYLPIWATAAGIDKHLTLHTFRHTYATLQLTLGTDLFTVSKMLGHKDVKTTQIYAKIIDEKKREAANKIQLK